MNLKVYVKNYINAYEGHFKNEDRNDYTFKNLQMAGWLLDTKFPEFTKDATYYKKLYEKCMEVK